MDAPARGRFRWARWLVGTVFVAVAAMTLFTSCFGDTEFFVAEAEPVDDQ